jgi:hypothetical protein
MWYNPQLKLYANTCSFNCRKFILLSSGIPNIPTKLQDVNNFETITGSGDSTDLSGEFHLWPIDLDFCDVCPLAHETPHGVHFVTNYNFTSESLIWLANWIKFYQHLDKSANIQLYSLFIGGKITVKMIWCKKFIQFQRKMVKHIQI